ncbi:MAG: TonB-dependent receptor plug domain-containing protein, partial [Flavisolibacter sp.]
MRSLLLRLVLASTSMAAYFVSSAGTFNGNDYKFKWQQTSLHGVVNDSKGNPVTDATVSVKGTSRTAVTASDGSYSIDARNGDVLVVTHVSFGTKEVTVGSATVCNVTLAETNSTLSDVVVVGYGRSSRRTLSSSVSSIKAEDLNKGAIADVGQLLQGKVPGLNITASGDPNRTAAVILRGASTVNSPQGPFYVIDGVPGADIALIAPDDIASIDVLKDASATAIYGNRAANGVIMVTTKRGRKGQSQVSYNGYVATEQVSDQLKVMNASQLRDFLTRNNSAFTPADDKGANTDWQKAIEKTNALSTNHNL